jgi:cytoskeletal protein CcmA (bactofilin family)
MKMLRKTRKLKATRIDTLIGHQSQILGDIRFSGGLHIDGSVKGNVSVVAEVYASEHIELAASGRVEGNVYYSLIEMAMGAEVNGKLVRMADDQAVPLALGHSAAEAAE